MKFTIGIGAFHGEVKGRLLETDDGDSFVLDEVGSSVGIHGGIIQRVKNLTSFESFGTLVWREFGDIWNVTKSSGAKHYEVHHDRLFLSSQAKLDVSLMS